MDWQSLSREECIRKLNTDAKNGLSRQQASQLTLLSKEFEEKFTVTVPEKIRDLSLSSSRLYTLGAENLYEYDYSALLLNTVNTGVLSKQFVDYNGTLLITSTSVSKVEKTKSR